MWARLEKHFSKYNKLPFFSFCIKIALESLLVSVLIAGALLLVFGNRLDTPTQQQELEYYTNPESFMGLFVAMVVLAPLIETVLFQTIPIGLTRLFRLGKSWQFGVSTIAFTLPHFGLGVDAGLAAGLVGGVYLAYVYLHWQKTSLKKAF